MQKSRQRASTILFSSLLLALLLFSAVAYAQSGPDSITASTPETRAEGSEAVQINAQAGNVTQLTIVDNRTSSAWQGYYGNVTSTVLLTNANNQSLYQWDIVAPSGEVYASNGSVSDWSAVRCANLTNDNSDDAPFEENQTILEDFFGINSGQSDGFDETFSQLYTGTFQVGGNTISTSDNCPLAYTFVDNASQSSSFPEVLLSNNNSIIFTSLLESNGAKGFDGMDYHFQMLVAEDGDSAGSTPYYFYVELE